tara:strand:- start:1694 stop:2164 length:471 start_codon:yes stop_codon:yes gene_type:complete
MKIPAIFKNKVLYYIVLAFSVLNVLGYVSMKAWECLALFSLTAYIVNMQLDNVTVALLAGIFVSNFIFSCGRVKEGIDKTIQSPEKDVEDAEKSLDRAHEKVQECEEGEEMVDGECVAIADEAMTTAKKAAETAKEAVKQVTDIMPKMPVLKMPKL